MVTNWLNRASRNPSVYAFTVVDMSEKIQIDDSIKSYLGEQTLIQYRSLEWLKKRYGNESSTVLCEYLRNNVFPSTTNQITKNVRQGDFGEILTTLVVEEFKNLKVPISKLRYKFNKDRSVFCTDLISHNQGNTITDITYYEVKTRITYSDDIGVKAYEGLLKDEKKPNESIADFLDRYYFDQAEIYSAAGDVTKANEYYSIAKQFGDLVKNPTNFNRRFEIIIIMETSKFKEDILTQLNSLSLQLSPLEVTVVLVDNLSNLVSEVFTKAEKVAESQVLTTSPSPKNIPV
ncbi:Hachiman antiphage defense system protein HamA [Flavilitoribacter nigricans]|uniref:Anti-bacteriophage protein A/HamA C-terminal domain-containing protein n=1 Tax=Flavilitoribacter nigricans (strain ATCC 23147 / DSM 23189 / NBRC 102662 / NCIMB 1420 / SS-2) TaxID=1122177 RepID=A0A2D0MZ05_FLAN2|nr:Hachiman antiphage defense system protein HamA [Flavilitoribacter nigricans]PHN01119.1 hypothetical protein CRP01_38600 [Flavilitoribacter nigricans DSM 23189 = NBRC 102662]